MTIGLVVFGAGAAGAALASSAPMLIVMRGLQGVGAALVLPATLSIITNVFPRGERAKAIAIWTAVGALGVGLGPALGGYLVDQFGWSAAFWLLVPMVAVALVGMRIVPESRDQRNLRLDIPGAILGTAGLIALVYGIIQGGDAGWTSPEILGTFGAAAALLGAFTVVELRSSETARHKIKSPDSAHPMFTDIHDRTDNVLYEAKGASSRNDIRLAIGQLLDYRRYIDDPAPSAIAVLLPSEPAPDMKQLLSSLSIKCMFRTPSGTFETT